MAANLADKACIPCRGGFPPLEAAGAKEFLSQAPSWTLMDDAHRIERTFRFLDFKGAIAFVNKIGELAEAEGHHPDLHLSWVYVTVSMHTHKIKRLHENDFSMAAKITRLAEAGAN